MTTVRHDYSVILRVTNNTPEMLILTTATGDTLPQNENPMHFWQSCEIVNQALAEKYGLHVTTIRCLEPLIDNGEGQPLLNVYLHLYHEGAMADDMRWVAIDKVPQLNLPPVINNVQKWVGWLQSDHPQRKSWYNFTGVQATIQQVEEQFDVTPQQVRTWERSAVWRIPTEQGNRYLKDVPSMFSFEVPLTKWLYENFSDHSTLTLDWDNPQQLLMADYGGQPLAPDMDLEKYESAMATYARMQIDLVDEIETLKNLGVSQRPVQWICDNLEAFLSDETNLTRGRFPLTAGQIETIQHALPHLKHACDVLSNSAIPDTLEHGDLWIGQIIIRDKQPIFTDWSDSAITCPLFSLPYFVTEASDMPDEPDARNHIGDAYLDMWSRYANRETLDKLMPHVNVLSPLYTALRYHHDILPAMEHQWEMENMVTYNLRLLLKALNI